MSYVSAGAVRPGDQIRVRLTDEGSVRLSALVGPGAETLTGMLVEQQDTAWLLKVLDVTRRAGTLETWSGERVLVPLGAMGKPARREFSVRRTVLLVAGLVVAAGAFGQAIVSESLGGGRTGGTSGGGK